MTDVPTATAARRTWISWAIAVLIVISIGGLTSIAGGLYLASRYMTAGHVAPQAAADEFERTLGRFSGQTALIQLRGDDVVVHRTPDRPRRTLTTVHVLAYDTRAAKLVNITVPGWLL